MGRAVAAARFVLEVDLSTGEVRGHPAPHWRAEGLLAIAGHAEDTKGAGSLEKLAATAYSAKGEAFTIDLNGQYCGAILRLEPIRLLLFQDPLGLQDLFWSRHRDRILVASDLDLLLGVSETPDLDETYFAELLGSTGQDRSHTPFAGIHRLAYGASLEITRTGSRSFRTWHPPSTPSASPDNAEDTLRSLLDAAVAANLPAKGRVISELSGGLDSSSILATARKQRPDVEALSYLSTRGTVGQDAHYASEMINACPVRWHRLDLDAPDIIPDQFGRFIPEPRAMLFLYQFDAISEVLRARDAEVLLTGSVGDVIFEFAGIVPAFLADSLAAARPRAAMRLAREWAAAQGGQRSWTHYMRHVAAPIAWARWRGRSLLDWLPNQPPPWIDPDMARVFGLAGRYRAPLLPSSTSPGRQHLWESIVELAAFENVGLYRGLSADVRHPLYYRPLVEFMLGLDFRVRRGVGTDRRLQRAALADRLPSSILSRRSKGSAQELRERHLMESDRWYRMMTEAPRLIERGWVNAEIWRDEVERARLGVAGLSAPFMNAVNTELWLRALEETPRPPAINLEMAHREEETAPA